MSSNRCHIGDQTVYRSSTIFFISKDIIYVLILCLVSEKHLTWLPFLSQILRHLLLHSSNTWDSSVPFSARLPLPLEVISNTIWNSVDPHPAKKPERKYVRRNLKMNSLRWIKKKAKFNIVVLHIYFFFSFFFSAWTRYRRDFQDFFVRETYLKLHSQIKQLLDIDWLEVGLLICCLEKKFHVSQ